MSGDTVKLPPLIGNAKLVVGLLYGVVCGLFHVMGAPAFVSFLALSGVTGFMAVKRTSIDVDEMGSKSVLFTEGFMPSLAVFVLAWTATYNVIYRPMSMETVTM